MKGGFLSPLGDSDLGAGLVPGYDVHADITVNFRLACLHSDLAMLGQGGGAQVRICLEREGGCVLQAVKFKRALPSGTSPPLWCLQSPTNGKKPWPSSPTNGEKY